MPSRTSRPHPLKTAWSPMRRGRWRPYRRSSVIPDAIDQDACLVILEVCNNVDDNCNQQIDEGFDKLTDPRYCDSCKGCMGLVQLHAYPGCKAGQCVIQSCAQGYVDLDQKVENGCEYACVTTGVEICDGLDNDCDNQIDEGVTLTQQICKTLGPCQNAKAVCQGSQGWQCDYGSGVELQPCGKDEDCGSGFKCVNNVCPGIVIIDEKRCDGLDGDCDGVKDDPWANPVLPTALGKTCDPTKACTKDADCGGAGSKCVNDLCSPKLGACREEGQWVCDPTAKDKAICQLTTKGQTPVAETCNGIDDNCDGQIDNGTLGDEKWVTVGSFKIFKYEASRPDANGTTSGILSTGRPCSVPSRLPWGSITKEEAQAACVRAGARLCKTSEWEQACRSENTTTFPYGNTFKPEVCNGREYDAQKDAALVTNLPAGCTSVWGSDKVFNMSGNLKEWTATNFSGATPTAYEIKGGAYDTPSIKTFGAGLSCTYDLPAPSSTLQIPTLGFRCCK